MPDDANDLSPETAEPVFLVTSENRLGRSSRWTAFGIVAAFGLLLIVAGHIGAYRAERGIAAGEANASNSAHAIRPADDALIASAMGMVMIGLALFAGFSRYLRGAWVLDSFGIEFQPLRGAPQSLKWSQVEAVRTPWSIAQMRFRGRGIAVPFTLAYEEKETQRRIRDALKGWLGDSFDLRYRGPSLSRGGKMKGLALAAPIVLCLCAAAVYAAYDDPYLERMWLTLGLVFSIYLVPFVAFAISRWKSPQPYSSWRYRKPPADKAE